MPELPEVETLKRSLEKSIVGHKIISFMQFRESLRYNLDPDLAKNTVNSFIVSVRRIAKYLIIDLSNSNSIIFHLGMTGRLTFRDNSYDFQKHDHIAMMLEDRKLIVFNDVRRFGMVYTCVTNELKSQKFLQNIGPEPFFEQFSINYLENCFKNRKIPIKSAIMDNRIVVGVGNIYASESLFLSKIHPLKPAYKLTQEEVSNLIKSIIIVLNQAIEAGGTTLKDFVNGDNKPGYFKQKLNVYGRKELDCYFCTTKILKIIQSGRATYFCPICQN